VQNIGFDGFQRALRHVSSPSRFRDRGLEKCRLSWRAEA